MCKIPEFVDLIRGYRLEHGLSTEKMAEKCGVSCRHYPDLEKGKKSPSGETLIRIFTNLGLDMNLLKPAPKTEAEILEH